MRIFYELLLKDELLKAIPQRPATSSRIMRTDTCAHTYNKFVSVLVRIEIGMEFANFCSFEATNFVQAHFAIE